MADSIKDIQAKIRAFRDARDWLQFHDAKSMAASIVIEGGELLEHFQWRSKEEAEEYVKTHKEDIAEEVADIANYLFEFCDLFDIDLIEAMSKKIDKNDLKYPVDKAKGKHTKYTQFS